MQFSDLIWLKPRITEKNVRIPVLTKVYSFRKMAKWYQRGRLYTYVPLNARILETKTGQKYVMELESHTFLISFSSIQGVPSTFGQVFVSGDPESQLLQY